MRNMLLEMGEGQPCYKVAELCLCSSVLWNIELVSNEIGYLAEEISEQIVDGVAWLLLTAFSKMQEEMT